MTHSELETEISILEVEVARLSNENRDLQGEIDRLRGLAAGAGVELAMLAPANTPTTEIQVAVAMQALDADRQAIQELHNPPPPPGKVESTLDVVRANNLERAALQAQVARLSGVVSRVGAAIGVDTWGDDGAELLLRAQSMIAPPIRIHVDGDDLVVFVQRYEVRRGLQWWGLETFTLVGDSTQDFEVNLRARGVRA